MSFVLKYTHNVALVNINDTIKDVVNRALQLTSYSIIDIHVGIKKTISIVTLFRTSNEHDLYILVIV